MIYECLIHKASKTMCVAKPEGWKWSDAERDPKYWEIVKQDIAPIEPVAEPTITIHTSVGDVLTKAGKIDKSLECGLTAKAIMEKL